MSGFVSLYPTYQLCNSRLKRVTTIFYMPFTPFHFGPSACVALPLNRYIDLPVFLLANVAVDIEPLLVMMFNLSYPLHGYAHTLVGAALVGLAWGGIAYGLRGLLTVLMTKGLHLAYSPSRSRMLMSGVLGAWFHVALDAPLYTDIRPFWPLSGNPLLGMIESDAMYAICAYSFIPAVLFYLVIVYVRNGRRRSSE